MMNGTCGIEAGVCIAPSGLKSGFVVGDPGADAARLHSAAPSGLRNRESTPAQLSFTLLELLLTLTILSLILLAVWGMLARTVESSRRAESRQRRLLVLDALQRRFAEDLRGVFLPDPSLLCFKGDSQQIDFTTTADALVPFGQKVAFGGGVGYRMARNEQNPDYYRLLRREQRGEDPMKGGKFQEMYPWVKHAEFHYLVSRREGRQETRIRKLDTWDNLKDQGFPVAVEITLELAFSSGISGRSLEDTLDKAETETFTTLVPLPCGGPIPFIPKQKPAAQESTEPEAEE